jgi:hypothetical protein
MRDPLKALLPTAFSIVRFDIASARAEATNATAEARRYRVAIEKAVDLLRAEPRDGFRVRVDRAAVGLRLALLVT